MIINLQEPSKIHQVSWDQEILQIQVLKENIYFMCHKAKEEEYTLHQVAIGSLLAKETPVKMKAIRVNEVLSYTKT